MSHSNRPFAALLAASVLGFVLVASQGCSVDLAGNPCPPGNLLKKIDCGVGACHTFIDACVNGELQTCSPLVAEDEETPDGIDNDCDGVIDDGSSCEPFTTQECYSGSLLSRGNGLCHVGVQACQNGIWSDCSGDILPAAEDCNQRDDDCDGEVDEGCPCSDKQKQSCYGGPEGALGTYPCRQGVQACKDGFWGECKDQVVPALDEVNGIDDDCDGETDEGGLCPLGAAQPCFTGSPETEEVGVCRRGVQVCETQGWGACLEEVVPTAELCNFKDDDCNGVIDDAASGTGVGCTTSMSGACKAGSMQCGPDGLYCAPQKQGSPEVCNGMDDNCDGIVDNGQLCCPLDAMKNGSESDVNCGGVCPDKCASGKLCNIPSDCASGVCSFDKCQNPACNDNVKNGSESDVDCGAMCPAKCLMGQSCKSNPDCLSGTCMNELCE